MSYTPVWNFDSVRPLSDAGARGDTRSGQKHQCRGGLHDPDLAGLVDGVFGLGGDPKAETSAAVRRGRDGR